MSTLTLVGAASIPPRRPRDPDALTWGLIAALVAEITFTDLIAYQGQKAGMTATISQAILRANRRTRGLVFVVVTVALGILAGHLFIPRADCEPMNAVQLAGCAFIGLFAFGGAIVGTSKLYQRR